MNIHKPNLRLKPLATGGVYLVHAPSHKTDKQRINHKISSDTEHLKQHIPKTPHVYITFRIKITSFAYTSIARNDMFCPVWGECSDNDPELIPSEERQCATASSWNHNFFNRTNKKYYPKVTTIYNFIHDG